MTVYDTLDFIPNATEVKQNESLLLNILDHIIIKVIGCSIIQSIKSITKLTMWLFFVKVFYKDLYNLT